MYHSMIKSILVTILFLPATISANDSAIMRNDRVNIMVVNKIRDFDFYTKTLYLRAKIKSTFSNGRFIVVTAKSSEHLWQNIETICKSKRVMIGTLWFDSHGYFKNGYSSFSIGNEEMSYKTIRDSIKTLYLKKIAAFCDEHTKVIIGSCYGGATYQRTLDCDTSKMNMNGDSLMIGLSDNLNNSMIYGSESWVMMKPGIFNNGYAFAGNPLGKKYNDKMLKPVWQRMGIWNQYCGKTKKMQQIPPIRLNKYADVSVNRHFYQDKKIQKKIEKRLKKLEDVNKSSLCKNENRNDNYLR